MTTLREVHAALIAAARRHSRVSHEAEDLAHDLVLSALSRGSALDDETFLRSLHGSARRHGAFLARTAGRRRAREEAVAKSAPSPEEGHDAREDASYPTLSPPLPLGLTFEVEDFENGYLQARVPGDVELVFLQGDVPRGGSPQVVFGLAKGGIDHLVPSLATAGVDIVTPVTEAPGG